jgi:hypothetical protein
LTAKEKIEQTGFEDVILLDNYSYDDALVGVTCENRAVYDFDKMVEWLVSTQSFSHEEAVEFIEYNTIGFLLHCDGKGPIIMYNLER